MRRAIKTGETNLSPLIAKVYSALDKAAKSNYIHKNKASRKKSRVAKMVNKILAKN